MQQAFGKDTFLPADPKAKANSNPALVFDRYLRIWHETADSVVELSPRSMSRDRASANTRDEDGGSAREKADVGKREDLEAFCTEYAARAQEGRGIAEDGKGIVAATHRRLNAFLKKDNRTFGEERTYKTRGRVVTGLGGFHPLENGFVFDRSSGAPYFPGSSIKGLCRAAAETILQWPQPEIDELFGPELNEGASRKPDRKAGCLIFLPAFPAKDHWPKLEVDVVNNHHPSYYRELMRRARTRGNDAGVLSQFRPMDSPVPVFFLTVAAGTPFTFRICNRSALEDLGALQRAFSALEAGLDYLGVGAKTASGYGTFDVQV